MLGVHANKKKKKNPRELHIKYYNFCNNYPICQTVTDCLSLSHESIIFFFYDSVCYMDNCGPSYSILCGLKIFE